MAHQADDTFRPSGELVASIYRWIEEAVTIAASRPMAAATAIEIRAVWPELQRD